MSWFDNTTFDEEARRLMTAQDRDLRALHERERRLREL